MASANRSHSRGLASFAPIVAQYLATSVLRSIFQFQFPDLLLLRMLQSIAEPTRNTTGDEARVSVVEVD